MLTLNAESPPQPAAGFIRDSNTLGFEKDVIAASMTRPVVVEFWATWCGPCKQLMPMLEKHVTAANAHKSGVAVEMVKIDIDKSPELAQAMRVQSVPMVYAFFQGQPVDGFMGVRPDSEIKAFIDKLVKLAPPDPAEETKAADAEAIKKTIAAGEAFLRDDDIAQAMASFSTALDLDPENMGAMASLAWCFVAQKDMEAVSEILADLNDEQKKHPRIKGLLWLKKQAVDAGVRDAADVLQARLDKNPADLHARYGLALQALAAAELETAIDALVEVTRRDRNWNEEQARKLLLDLIEALGPTHPMTPVARRRLSAVLFS